MAQCIFSWFHYFHSKHAFPNRKFINKKRLTFGFVDALRIPNPKTKENCVSIKQEFMWRWLLQNVVFTFSWIRSFYIVCAVPFISHKTKWNYWRKIETKTQNNTQRWTLNEHVKQMILRFVRPVRHRNFALTFLFFGILLFVDFCLSYLKRKL